MPGRTGQADRLCHFGRSGRHVRRRVRLLPGPDLPAVRFQPPVRPFGRPHGAFRRHSGTLAGPLLGRSGARVLTAVLYDPVLQRGSLPGHVRSTFPAGPAVDASRRPSDRGRPLPAAKMRRRGGGSRWTRAVSTPSGNRGGRRSRRGPARHRRQGRRQVETER